MSPLYDFDEDGWTRTIDLRTLHTIGRGAEGAWMVCWGQFEASVPPAVGAAIRAAWRAYHGTHAPAELVGVPVLPEGWEMRRGGSMAVYLPDVSRYVIVQEPGVDALGAPPEVVLAVIAAHRARGVR